MVTTEVCCSVLPSREPDIRPAFAPLVTFQCSPWDQSSQARPSQHLRWGTLEPSQFCQTRDVSSRLSQLRVVLLCSSPSPSLFTYIRPTSQLEDSSVSSPSLVPYILAVNCEVTAFWRTWTGTRAEWVYPWEFRVKFQEKSKSILT